MAKRVIKKESEKENVVTKEENVLKNFFKIFLVVIGILIVVYLIIAIFFTKDINIFGKDEVQSSTQSNNVLITDTFTINDKEYYVFIYDDETDDYSEIREYLNSKGDIKLYNVDLGNSINKGKLSDTSNKNAQSYSELQIEANTLIKIREGKNVLYLNGKDEIINGFN